MPATPLWTIRLLGGLRAESGERTVTRFRSRNIGALLAYLALHRRLQPREELCELLWPGAEPAVGRANLRTALASLRRQLEPPGVPAGAVLMARGHLSVGLNADTVTTDVAGFETALASASRCVDQAERAQRLAEAVRCYGGPLLPGLYEDWIFPERERLAQNYLAALRVLTTHHEAAGDKDAALDYAHRAAAAEPFDEGAHSALLRLLTAAGQTQAAQRQRREFERRLQGETDEAPLVARPPTTRPPTTRPPTARREQTSEKSPAATFSNSPSASPASSPCDGDAATDKVLSPRESQHPDDTDTAARSSAARSSAARPQLPLQFTRFFGREDEVAAVARMLRDEPNRLVTISGPGGMGKTRLAIEAAEAWRTAVPQAAGANDTRGTRRAAYAECAAHAESAPLVAFVSLAGVAAPERIAAAIAEALQLAPAPTTPPLEQVVQALSPAGPVEAAGNVARNAPRVLLVLDNFEHLVDTGGATVVQTLLARVPCLCCLVTSRQRLLLGAEREFALPPLPVPPLCAAPERLMQFAGVQLFVDRAQAARPDFGLTARNARAVAELCARLDGLPLAIELCAAWSQTQTPAQLLARLDQRLELLVSRRRDLPQRHRSLRAVLDSSHQMLPPAVQRFFARLSVFRGGWTAEAAQAVCEDAGALDHLTMLRERSLIGAEERGDEMRFGMLEVVREYAAGQLPEAEGGSLARRHAAYFVALAERAEPHLRGAEQMTWLAQLEAEHNNLRAVLETWRTEPQAALRLAGALERFWLLRGHWREGRDWLQKILVSHNSSSLPARAKALLSAATLAWALDAYEEASALGEESLSACREQGDLPGVAAALALLGTVAVRRGQGERATALLEESVARFREIGDLWGIAHALDNLAFVARDGGDHARAAALYQESLDLRRTLDDRHGIAVSLSNLGDAAQLQSDWERAAALHEQSLHHFRALEDKVGIAYALGRLAPIALHQGNKAGADALHRESLALFWELRDKRRIAKTLEAMAALCRRARGRDKTARLGRAARLLAAASALRAAIGAPQSLTERADFERGMRATRAALSETVFTRAWAQGQAMTLEETVAFALKAESAPENAVATA